MTKFNKTLLAAALALGASSAYALPSFETGGNQIGFYAYENQYRSAANCVAIGGCLPANSSIDPSASWQQVDPSIPGNTLVGDVFAGVFKVRDITHVVSGTTWASAAGDEFTGYFAQEIKSIVPKAGSIVVLNMDVPTIDPFGYLGANEMFRLYTDGSTAINLAGTVQTSIASAINGTFWGSLGLIAAGNGEAGYAYTEDDTALSGAGQFVSKSFMGLNVINKGGSYNAGVLDPVNDVNETTVGGLTGTGFLKCTAADVASGTTICNELVGSAEIELNAGGVGGGGTSPWFYLANDPLDLSRQAVPEPATLALLGLGLIGLAGLRRRAA